MPRHFEVVHVADGHLFDAESYECKMAPDVPRERESGYYLVLSPPQAPALRYDSHTGFLGPFETEQLASSCACAYGLDVPAGHTAA